ncbi:hypothetical protein DAD186_05120 [Dermabacter vaginalis]|uniref:Uncharacterized protein n=1 Tax=Dermabacter vaginalis TaxID=1630135 RepID=A0A1B0ZGL7_9MICO|nr:hypothetical protein DAD186_05120 [Dermabacter vaginalis]
MPFRTDEEVDIMQLFHLDDGLCGDECGPKPLSLRISCEMLLLQPCGAKNVMVISRSKS